MGLRGPAPKPTALKQLQGNPGKRALNHREAQPARPASSPRAPRWLSDEGKGLWRKMAPRLHPVGLLTEVDEPALAMLCEAWGQYLRAQAVVDEKGAVIKTVNGNLIQNPFLAVANRAKRDALLLMREFGMTPSARSRIQVGDGEEEESLADQLFRLVEGGR